MSSSGERRLQRIMVSWMTDSVLGLLVVPCRIAEGWWGHFVRSSDGFSWGWPLVTFSVCAWFGVTCFAVCCLFVVSAWVVCVFFVCWLGDGLFKKPVCFRSRANKERSVFLFGLHLSGSSARINDKNAFNTDRRLGQCGGSRGGWNKTDGVPGARSSENSLWAGFQNKNLHKERVTFLSQSQIE